VLPLQHDNFFRLKLWHIRLSLIIACLGWKMVYTSMRDCVGPLGI
jgi:hypothetical protein